MLDLFSIFTKGGIVLWYFQGTALSLNSAVNALVKTVLLQERGGMSTFNHDKLLLQFKLDNEFELIFVVAYQSILKLSYVDKLLDQISLAFRDRYKNQLTNEGYNPSLYAGFAQTFKAILSSLEQEHNTKSQMPREMKRFEESKKFERSRQGQTKELTGGTKSSTPPPPPPAAVSAPLPNGDVHNGDGGTISDDVPSDSSANASPRVSADKMKKIINKRRGTSGKSSKPSSSPNSSLSSSSGGKKTKQGRSWVGVVSREEAASLDYSSAPKVNGVDTAESSIDTSITGSMVGQLKPLQEEDAAGYGASSAKPQRQQGGVMSFFKSLTAGKTITLEAMEPALDKMREHLITKNVAAEIADKLCESVSSKLVGKTIGTFTGIQGPVRASMEESLVQILSPKRRIDMLRDAMQARDQGRPYVVTFCGVNGVGKSTNLAKVCFWLMENGMRVLIAGCDTFRSGAVEQLRTHKSHLSSLHPPAKEGDPPKVMLYERGYGKDAAGIANEAIAYARQQHYDVVLVDTAGRMQDNEPLMKSLAKLIRVNQPDLVLFVGEALVGNEAVDQLVKFNRALIDHAQTDQPQTIDGIVLTKFDTIDDKVGAAISMTYTTGQPIVFVGTGQTYRDLKTLNVQAVINSLLK